MKFRNPFKRKSPKIEYGPCSPDPWEVGDCAECVVSDNWRHLPTGQPSANPPRIGQRFWVTSVRLYEDAQYLEFRGRPLEDWNAAAFRKIRPDEQEACETEFVTLLKRSKRKVEA